MLVLVSVALCLLCHAAHIGAQNCRNIPGSSGFPTDTQWQALNASVSGRLVRAIPSGEYCRRVSCTDAEWTSAIWRSTVPGAMNQVNWEQDYGANPPLLCGRISPTTCGQGNVPPYAIFAEQAKDIQAGVAFALEYNIRLSVKASGHDYLGRSTAKHSLLIHTHKLQSIAFTEDFHVGGSNKGSAVTVGSGVALNTLYNATRQAGKIVVAGSAATVVAAGGYVQGAGHSPLSPFLGLAADNVLEFSIVTADGTVRIANEIDNSDRGAGSWGVIISATFKTFPTFNATRFGFDFTAPNNSVLGGIAQAHAEHLSEWDSFNVGQYVSAFSPGPETTSFNGSVLAFFPNATISQANAALAPFIQDVVRSGGLLTSNTSVTSNINELLEIQDDVVADYVAMGSRLIPTESIKSSPQKIGDAYKQLADAGSLIVLSALVAGGKVAENAVIDSAVNPGWREAKIHGLGQYVVLHHYMA